jgi:hypothetical protein
MKRRSFIYWLPRILGILFLCFLALFSLDVFGMEGTMLQKIGGFFIHNIPVFILLGVLIVSWKYELVGTTVFFLAAIFYMGMTSGNLNESGMMSAWLAIAGPALLISVLFFLSWREKKKSRKE